MIKQRLSSNGGTGRRGFQASTSSPGINSIRVLFEEDSFHYGNSNPSTSLLHTTANDTNFGYKTEDFVRLNRAFISFPKPHINWTRVLSGATGITMCLIGYHETLIVAPNNNVRFTTSLTIVRTGETVNYVAPAGNPPIYNSDIDCGVIPAFQLTSIIVPNYVVHNPSGLNPNSECMFHFRILRPDAGGGDTYPNVFRILGGFIEFPLA
jgi:hypothetical protein